MDEGFGTTWQEHKASVREGSAGCKMCESDCKRLRNDSYIERQTRWVALELSAKEAGEGTSLA